jgi:hypothetical protein
MAAPETDNRRRSSRVFARFRVPCKGKNAEGRPIRAVAETIVVNAHGALMYLDEPMEMSAELTIISPATQEEQECRVVFLGDSSERGRRVGVEFLSPAPHFWGVDFRPEDWPNKAQTVN